MSLRASEKYLITHTLLSAWEWSFKLEDGYGDFLRTLNREKSPPTPAMLDGNQFEAMVSAYNAGNPLDEKHKWHDGIVETADILRGSAEQVKLSREVEIDGINFVLYGILDNLRAGVIYDTKMSKTYHFGKYRDSTQHPMYFELCPEAYIFKYVIFTGRDVFVEEYRKDDTESIFPRIKQFMKWLDTRGLTDTYFDKWKSKF